MPETSPPQFVERTNLPIKQIDPNPWNPNVQDAEIFQLLLRSLHEEGFGEPILVRRTPDEPKPYQIVNGEHRYRLALETGMTHVPVAVVDMNVANAKLATLRRNRTRGGLDTIKTAELVRDMRKRLSTEEIAQRLGYSSSEQDELLGVLNAPFVPPGQGGGFGPPTVPFELQCTEEVARWLDSALLELAGKKEARFEGRSSRRRRGVERALKLAL